MTSSRAARIETLRAASARKRQETEAKVRRALMTMTARGVAVDFGSVAEHAGVSTAYLYKHHSLRVEIAGLRKPPPARVEARAAAVKSRDASSQVKLSVAVSALRELRKENDALRSENARLLGELAAARAMSRRPRLSE